MSENSIKNYEDIMIEIDELCRNAHMLINQCISKNKENENNNSKLSEYEEKIKSIKKIINE